MIRRRRPLFAAMAAALMAAAGLGGASFAQPADWTPEAVADQILVEKTARKMTLFSNGRPVRSYRIALGRGGLGPKQRQGDGKVPEGRYYITGRNPESSYYLALRIGYPTSVQADQAAMRGIDPGGDIMIHGLPNHLPRFRERHRREDWTDGCIAVTNEEIEEIWQLVPDWAIIEIRS